MTTDLFRAAALLLLASGSSTLCVLILRAPEQLPLLGKRYRRVATTLRFIRASLRARDLLRAQALLLALALGLAWLMRSPNPLWFGIAVLLVPEQMLARLSAQRVARIEAQLDAWLMTLANALRATPSLADAVRSTLALTPAPLRQELDVALKEYQLGLPLDRAFEAGALRIGSRSFTAVMLTLRVARSAGGDLSRNLETSAASLREMARLDGVIRTKTAEGKAQALVICLMPGLLVPALHFIDPGFLAPLTSTRMGHAVCALALLQWLVAVVMAYRIVQVDI